MNPFDAAANPALKKDAILVAESTDRFIRSVYFHTQENPSVQPTAAEYDDLLKANTGVTLATIVHPDRPSRSYQTKRGQQTKGNKGGRPEKPKPGYKKQLRLEKLPHVLQLRRDGASYRKIAAKTGIDMVFPINPTLAFSKRHFVFYGRFLESW